MEKVLANLRAKREKLQTDLEGIATRAADAERTKLSEEEQREWDGFKAEIDEIDARVKELVELSERQSVANDAARKVAGGSASGVRVISEPGIYDRGAHEPGGQRRSFFSDLFLAQRRANPDSMDRLVRHAKAQGEEIDRRKAAYERVADELREQEFEFQRMTMPLGASERAAQQRARYELETRSISRTDGSGGEFVPPLWLIDEYVPLARAARPFVDTWNVRPLPPGTDTISIPKVSGGTTVIKQAGDNAAVSNTDMTTTSITCNVETIAGMQDLSIQLLEQSPIAFDEVVFSDLIAAYNAELDRQALNGAGHGSFELQGILGLAGTNAVSYTDATPTMPELWPKIMDAINQAANGRKLPPTEICLAGRRWWWAAASLDSNGRPFIVPTSNGPTNAAGIMEDVLAQGGPVGTLVLPTIIDLNMPVNLGAGTNEDRAIVSRPQDFWLFESFLRTRVLNEVGSGTLTVRVQLYNYVAGTAGRYPSGTSIISGTGLITPTF